MKRINVVLSGVLGAVLLVSFQNCSSGNFLASDQSTEQNQGTKTVVTDDQIQNWLDSDKAYACPAFSCAAPPVGFHYEADNTVDSLCPTSCGRLVADKIEGVRKHIIACTDVLCTPIPEGCKRVADTKSVSDTNGCNLSCGSYVCDDVKSTGKAVDNSGTDNRETKKAAEKADEKINDTEPIILVANESLLSHQGAEDSSSRIRCPAIRCVAPPENCYYRQVSSEKNACPTCGELICRKKPFSTDMPPVPTF